MALLKDHFVIHSLFPVEGGFLYIPCSRSTSSYKTFVRKIILVDLADELIYSGLSNKKSCIANAISDCIENVEESLFCEELLDKEA